MRPVLILSPGLALVYMAGYGLVRLVGWTFVTAYRVVRWLALMLYSEIRRRRASKAAGDVALRELAELVEDNRHARF